MTPTQLISLINAEINDNTPDGITGEILNNILVQMINLQQSSLTGRLITSSAAVTLLATDFRVGFNRTAGLAATQVQLVVPSGGPEVVIQDLAGNFSTYPLTVSPPGGQYFAGNRTTYTMNEDNQTARFAYYGSGLWGVEPS